MKMMQNGASGFLLKSTDTKELVECINEAISGKLTFCRSVQDIISFQVFDDLPIKLTSREKEILELVSNGVTTSEIAEKLFISKLTVESHRKNLMQKFKAKNMVELIKKALQEGLL